MIKVKISAVVLSIIVLLLISAAAVTMEYHNPLIDPRPIETYLTPAQNIKNILMLGIDKNDASAARGSDYHTDAIMVLAVNFDEKRVDMISLPRDSVTYVPGIKGIYKLNAAINCGGGKTEEGFQKVCEAASWLLGGIKIDHYCAVDMRTMKAIGDAIGGVDFEVEMSYSGDGGKYYKGFQHLNGTGIMDYLRARRNATVNSNDLGRTGRQRDLMMAIFKKVLSDNRYLTSILSAVQKLDHAFFTNMSLMDMADYFRFAAGLNTENIGSYVLEGKYRSALNGWNFTFTDQANRQEVIKKVFGVKVPELKYVSYPYTKWLVEHGFAIVRYLSVAKQLREDVFALGISKMNAEQKEALDAFDSAYDKVQYDFDAAAESMSEENTEVLTAAGKELRKCGDALFSLFAGVDKPVWANGQYWYADRMINEIDVNFR
jgi:polyisoprenyl-teichoic acid--peptidoglycan teichoic acid transferase